MNLREDVERIINNHLENGYSRQDFINDLATGGCESGLVSDLVYTRDTLEFYEKHKGEINEVLSNLLNDTGLQPAALFGSKWDATDPLAIGYRNRNLLAWFAFEAIALENY